MCRGSRVQAARPAPAPPPHPLPLLSGLAMSGLSAGGDMAMYEPLLPQLQLYQFLNEDLADDLLVVPPVDAHNDLFIQQQLVGDDDSPSPDYHTKSKAASSGHLPPPPPPPPQLQQQHSSLLANPKAPKRAKKALASPVSGEERPSSGGVAGGLLMGAGESSGMSSSAKVRAACSNCRASHVACSHEVPCRRCVEHGLEASCQYLPRKKRTNFKKRKADPLKDELPSSAFDDPYEEDSSPSFPAPSSSSSLVDHEAALRMEELRRNPPSSLLLLEPPSQAAASSPTTTLGATIAGGRGVGLEQAMGLWNATVDQLFGDEYAFPLVNTNIPAHSQPQDYGLPLLSPPDQSSSSPQSSSSSPHNGSAPQSPERFTQTTSSSDDEDNKWLAQLIGGEPSPMTSSLPTSPTQAALALYNQTHSNPPFDYLKGTGLVDLSTMSTVSHPYPLQKSSAIKPQSPASTPLSPGSVSARTVNLLQEMKAKNERLERLLSDALADIQELKRREKLREHHNVTMQSLVQLQNIGPADEFRKGVPALAMFALSSERHGAILQANDNFRNLVGYSFEHLASPGFTCCKLFPERFKAKLCKDYEAIMSGSKSSGQDDLVILRGDGREVPVRAFYHIIYDDVGRPLYKMFYAFPLL